MTLDEFKALGLPDRISRWANHLFAAYLCYEVDPITLAAIMDRESLGGNALVPPGPGGTGDSEHGLGLMQIDNRFHSTFAASTFGPNGEKLWADPALNIMYAAKLLRENLVRSSWNYPVSIAAYNAGLSKAMAVGFKNKGAGDVISKLDQITTDKNYVSDVLERRADYMNHKGADNA